MTSVVDENDRRVVLSPEQKREIAEFQGLGFTYSEARWQVLTQEQKQDLLQQNPRVVLSPEQKRVAAELRGLGLRYTQARREVLSPEQKQEHDRQIRDAELRRYEKNPYREIIMKARQSANSARKRNAKHGAHEFTITEDDLDWPTHCPVLGMELHYPGHYHLDPAGVSFDRVNVRKDYVPGNVRVISLRANLLRKDATAAELVALADYYTLNH
jgi:hypothetical protein